jgi:hypothetical protein
MVPKVIYVIHSGIAIPYLTCMLTYLHQNGKIDLQPIGLKQFNGLNNIPEDVVIIYQTYADENHHKFVKCKQIIDNTDDIIINHKKTIIFDAHDSGSVDGFSRLPKLPRIKNTPNILKMQEYNIISSTTFPLKTNMCPKDWQKIDLPESGEKSIDISYKVGLMEGSEHSSMYIRRKVQDLLNNYVDENQVSMSLGFDKKISYNHHIAQTKISVNVPGYGEACIRHLITLCCGSCMLAHESINNIKLLPGANLVEGDDYLSFNLDNFCEKLDYLISNPQEIKRISDNGVNKFKEGYSIINPSELLLNYINDM